METNDARWLYAGLALPELIIINTAAVYFSSLKLRKNNEGLR